MRRHLFTDHTDHEVVSHQKVSLVDVRQEQQTETATVVEPRVGVTRRYTPLRAKQLTNARTLRVSYVRTWACLNLIGYVEGIVALHLMWLLAGLQGSYLTELRSEQPALLAGMFVGLFMAFPVAWTMRSDIGPEGLVTITYWGWRRALRWSEMTSARRARMLGIPYLRIGAEKGRALWLPLIPADKAAFIAALDDYTPTGHPIRQALHLGGSLP